MVTIARRGLAAAAAEAPDGEAPRVPVAFGEKGGQLHLEPVVALERQADRHAHPAHAGGVRRGYAERGAGGRAAVAERPGIDDALGRTLFAGGVERGPLAREDAADVVLEPARRFRGQRAVEQAAVPLHDARDPERRLHAALDLERRDAGRAQFAQEGGEGEVAHRKRERAVALLAAAVAAAPAVAAAAPLHRGVEAEPGAGVAEGAVEEGLDLAGAGARLDRGGDFLQGAFAGEDNARKAEVGHGADAFGGVHGHLGGSVEAERREVPARHAGDAGVLHDEGVRPEFLERLQEPGERRAFALAHERVERHVDGAARGERARVGEEGRELRRVEVAGLGAGREFAHA